MSKKRKKRRTAGDIIRNLVLILAIGVFAFSAFQLGKIFLEYKEGTDEYNRVREYVTVADTETEDKEDAENKEPEAPKPLPPQVDFNGLKAINPEVIGWIQIEGTSISYPIMKGKDNDYYLKHTFEGNYNAAGSIFIDYTNNSNFEDCNTIIYGHNMKNGSMFGHLKKFAEDQETYNKSKYFWILTPDKNYRYEIISAYTTGVNSDTYTLFKGPGDEFQSYLETIKGYSEIQTDPGELTIKDKIVTLSTCTGNESTRFVVQGKRDISEDAH